MNFRFRLFLAICFCFEGCAHVPPAQKAERPFDFKRDTFSFANETVWHYENGAHKSDSSPISYPSSFQTPHSALSTPQYAQHCFVLSRASVQFWKFARFDPGQPALSPEKLAERIRRVTERDVWQEPFEKEERIVFPGYFNLREMSRKEMRVFQENIGRAWPTYFRPGNFCIIETPSPQHQARTNDELREWLGMGQPCILWLYHFPQRDINHVVVAYRQKQEGPNPVYLVYDPNTPDHPAKLEYDRESRKFSFQKTFYFSGGPISVRPIYLSVLQ